jgi:hypothetical protein
MPNWPYLGFRGTSLNIIPDNELRIMAGEAIPVSQEGYTGIG